jgi:ArsR family transcriptional regulator
MIEAAKDRLAKLPHVSAEVADVHALPYEHESFDAVLMFHTLTYAEHPALALKECARVLRPGGRLVLLCLNEHKQQDVTARYGERHPGFSPKAVRGLLTRAGLEVHGSDVACREAKKPHLEVVLATADKPQPLSKSKRHSPS